MTTFIYSIWFLLPFFFFFLAFWSKLETWGGSVRKHNAGDLLRQGFFVLACVLVAIVIDQYILKTIVDAVAPEFIPLGFFQVMLLPVILLIAAKLVGPTQQVMIESGRSRTKYRKKK